MDKDPFSLSGKDLVEVISVGIALANKGSLELGLGNMCMLIFETLKGQAQS